MITLSTGVDLLFEPQSVAEWGRARDDYEWFASRFIPIADKEEALPQKLILNSSQRDLMWYFQNFRNEYGGGNFLVYKGRQFGCSTLVDTMFAHQALKGPGFRSFVFANETTSADNLLNIVRRPYWVMPQGYQLPDGTIVNMKPDEHRSNKKELWVYFDGDKTLESIVKIEEATAGAAAGIGHTSNAIHFSEVGKKEFDDGLAIGTAMQTASRDAFVVAEGTADGAYGWMYNTWQDVWDDFNEFRKRWEQDSSLTYNGWVPIFMPWFWHYGSEGGLRFPLKKGEIIVPETEWEEAAMAGDNTYLHWKCTPENIKAMRYLWENRIKTGASELGLSQDEFRAQEYPSNPEEGFIQSGSTFFDKEVIGAGLRFARDYNMSHTAIRYKWEHERGWVEDRYGDLRMFKEPEPNRYKYVIGGDCAEGTENNDWDTLTIVEVRPNGPNQVIGFWEAHCDDKYVHALMVRSLAEWCKSSKTAIEGDKFGHTVNDYLRNMGCRGLYIATPDDEGSFAPGHAKSYGWKPSGKSRAIMLGQLQGVLRKWFYGPDSPDYVDGLIVPFPEIWTQIQSFVKIRGKAQAAHGAHDDRVFSTGIANSVALDVVPKRAARKVDPIKQQIKYLESIGLKSAADFYRMLRRTNG